MHLLQIPQEALISLLVTETWMIHVGGDTDAFIGHLDLGVYLLD